MRRFALSTTCRIVLLGLTLGYAGASVGEPLQAQVTRDGVTMDLPDGYTTIPYLSPRGRLLVEPASPPGAPMRMLLMPFVRTGMDPYVFTVTTTATQYAISKPAAATSYRFVNPCDADVRIRKVSSMTESVTLTTGTLYLARTSEVVGTSSPEFVSLIAMKAPTGTCKVELQHGDGS